MESTIDAVIAGHICLDIIPAVPTRELHFRPGKLLEIGPAVVATGGAVSNTGLALYTLGVATRLMGKTGDDAFGEFTRGILARRDAEIANCMAVAAGEASSYSVILSPPGADRMFLHCPGCNDTFGADDIDYSVVSRARLFHFGYPPLMRRLIGDAGSELVRLLRGVKATGATVSLDMCMPDPSGPSGRVDWRKILARSLPCVDIFLPSLEEMLFMLEPETLKTLSSRPAAFADALGSGLPGRIAASLLAMGPVAVGLKLGEAGFYLRTAAAENWRDAGRALAGTGDAWMGRELWAPCFRVEVAGTTGAGDATIAGFLASLLRGLAPEECVRMACAVGACNVEAADALGGLRSWDETKRRVEEGWARLPVPAAQARWVEDSGTGSWRGPGDSRRSGREVRK